ncbi:hypothetical protein [Streptomyces sp. DT117]
MNEKHQCPSCGIEYPVTKQGLVRRHGSDQLEPYPDGRKRPCPGSGSRPR